MRPIYQALVRQGSGIFQKHTYNDARLASKGAMLLDRMTSKQSNVVHQIAETSAEEKSFYRFLNNNRVNPSEMIDHIYRPSLETIRDRSLVVIGDTSEISLKRQLPHMIDGARVGVLSDNQTPGYYLHSHLVLDAESGQGLGLSDLAFWMRKRSKGAKKRSADKRSWSQKESYSWAQGIGHSQEVLSGASDILYVFDAGADIANLWASAQNESYDLLIRVQHNDRKLAHSEQKLFDFLESLEPVGSYQLELDKLYRKNNDRKIAKRSKRSANMEVGFSLVKLEFTTEGGLVNLPLYVVETKERADSVPEGEDPVHWRLLSTRKVETLEQAMKMIQYYEWRWQTEELYRTSKKKGFAIEESELQSLDAILRQTILSLEAAFRVMRLVMSRDKEEGQAIADIFSPQETKCLEKLNQKVEGKTQKLSNPWPKDQLSWAAWVIARLGGWKGYQSKTPPGPIRMKRGLEKFYVYFDAWSLFRNEIDVGDS